VREPRNIAKYCLSVRSPSVAITIRRVTKVLNRAAKRSFLATGSYPKRRERYEWIAGNFNAASPAATATGLPGSDGCGDGRLGGVRAFLERS
jgi:hypothetical protein